MLFKHVASNRETFIMRTTLAQILFDLIGMMNTLIRFMNVANRKSDKLDITVVYVNLALEARIFLEQLNAEINTQRNKLNVIIEIEDLKNLKEPLLLENTPNRTNESILHSAYDQLQILIENYQRIFVCKDIPPTTLTLLNTQLRVLEGYSEQLKKLM